MGDTGRPQSSGSARGSVLTGVGMTPKWPAVRAAMAPGMSPAAIHLAGQGSRATTPQTEGSDQSVTTQDWLAPPGSAGPVTAAAAIRAGHASQQQRPSPPANWQDSPPPPPPPPLPPAPAPLVPQLGSPAGPAQAQAQAQSWPPPTTAASPVVAGSPAMAGSPEPETRGGEWISMVYATPDYSTRATWPRKYSAPGHVADPGHVHAEAGGPPPEPSAASVMHPPAQREADPGPAMPRPRWADQAEGVAAAAVADPWAPMAAAAAVAAVGPAQAAQAAAPAGSAAGRRPSGIGHDVERSAEFPHGYYGGAFRAPEVPLAPVNTRFATGGATGQYRLLPDGSSALQRPERSWRERGSGWGYRVFIGGLAPAPAGHQAPVTRTVMERWLRAAGGVSLERPQIEYPGVTAKTHTKSWFLVVCSVI